MNIQKVYDELLSVVPKEQLLLNEPMKRHTSFRIGGPADLMMLPSEVEHIHYTLTVCNQWNIPVLIMGNGSNLLVRDKGIRGVVIKIANCFNQIRIRGLCIRAQSGALLSVLAKRTIQAGLSGLEFASGIPGTLGGAVAMNAGAYGGEMKNVVESVDAMDIQGNKYPLNGDEIGFGYRTSSIQEKGLIVLEVTMRLKSGNYEQSKVKVAELTRRRQEKQPLSFPSAGSVFKRPEGYYAGKLIEDAGLKGMRIGDAQVSELHSGFIINLGNATAKDVISLIESIKQKVWENAGVELNPELKIVGQE